MDLIKLKDGRSVSKIDYAHAKTEHLRRFGYTNTTYLDVIKQIEKVLKGSKLSVIGKIIEAEISKT